MDYFRAFYLKRRRDPGRTGFPEVSEQTRLADEHENHFGSFSEHRFSNDGVRGLPLNPIRESFGALSGRRAVNHHRRLRQASAAGRFNGFVMGLR